MKLFRKIHLWLSVPFGIVITLVCFSGAMLVFEPEITRSIRHDVYYAASSQGEHLPMSGLMETVRASLPDSVSITGVTVFRDRDRTYQVNLSKPRRASVFIDQYTGRITGRYERVGFFSAMFRLHRWLLDSPGRHGGMSAGKLIVGISTLVFIIALITGVAIWIPRARRNFRHSLAISAGNGWRGLWRGLHVAGGMYVVVLALAMSLTGLTWSFDWYRKAFYTVCGVKYEQRNHDNGKPAKTGAGEKRECRHTEFGMWQKVYDELKSRNPHAPQITVGADAASVTLGTTGNTRASDRYGVDGSSGGVRLSAGYSHSAGADRLRGWIYAVHTGSWGGLFTRILWFLGALLGASLPITGYYMWIVRLRKSRHG